MEGGELGVISRLSNAIFDPRNQTVVVPVIIVVLLCQFADLAGLIEMNFQFASYMVSLAYLSGVLIHLRNPSE